MSVGFGFSVGDFLAALDASFRSLIDELYAPEFALLRVKRLDVDNSLYIEKIALQQAASQC